MQVRARMEIPSIRTLEVEQGATVWTRVAEFLRMRARTPERTRNAHNMR